MKVTIPIDIYSYKVVIVTTNDEMKSLGIETDHEFVCYERQPTIAILCSDLWGGIYNHNFIRCLSHECNHAAMSILNGSCVKFSYDHQEALCYLQDYILKTALDKFEIKIKKGNRENPIPTYIE